MKKVTDIQSDTDERGKKYFIIYSKDGTEHRIGQQLDALTAIETGAYFATKPEQKKVKKR